MPFSSLPMIALQLCIHGLDQRSLLQFARCSRATLAAACTVEAWSHLPAASVCCLQPDLAGSIARSALRFASGLHLRLLPQSIVSKRPSAAEIDSHSKLITHTLSSLMPRFETSPVSSLEARGWRGLDWSALLNHPVLASVRVLRLEIGGNQGSLGGALLGMKELESLCYDGQIDRLMMETLPTLPRLTDLSLALLSAEGGDPTGDELIRFVCKCRRLRRLSLRAVEAMYLDRLLTTPFPELQSLTLDDLFSPDRMDGVIDFEQLQQSMPALREIRLQECPAGSWALQPMRASPVIDSTPRRVQFACFSAEYLPSASDLRQALQANPQLSVSIEVFRLHTSRFSSPARLQARIRDVELFSFESDDSLRERLAAMQAKAALLRAVDPIRITVSSPDVDESREISDELARSAPKPARSWFSYCVIA